MLVAGAVWNFAWMYLQEWVLSLAQQGHLGALQGALGSQSRLSLAQSWQSSPWTGRYSGMLSGCWWRPWVRWLRRTCWSPSGFWPWLAPLPLAAGGLHSRDLSTRTGCSARLYSTSWCRRRNHSSARRGGWSGLRACCLRSRRGDCRSFSKHCCWSSIWPGSVWQSTTWPWRWPSWRGSLCPAKRI